MDYQRVDCIIWVIFNYSIMFREEAPYTFVLRFTDYYLCSSRVIRFSGQASSFCEFLNSTEKCQFSIFQHLSFMKNKQMYCTDMGNIIRTLIVMRVWVRLAMSVIFRYSVLCRKQSNQAISPIMITD